MGEDKKNITEKKEIPKNIVLDNQSFFTEFVKPVLILALVAVIAGASLSFVYDITEEKIREHQIEKVKDSLVDLFGNSDFEKLSNVEITGVTDSYLSKDKAYLAYLSEGQGYADKINILVGVDLKSETLVGIRIIDIKDTPGIGSKVTELPFLKTFEAVSIEKSGNIDTISGATISSKAVINAVSGTSVGIVKYLKSEGKI